MTQVLSSAGYIGEGRLARAATSGTLGEITVDLPPLLMFDCGWLHNIFITLEHQVFVCGENKHGQIGPDVQQCEVPTFSPELSALDPKWAACGDSITAILSRDGKVYVCGMDWGNVPVELSAPTEIIYITCGPAKICGIGIKGELFTWTSKTEATHMKCDAQICDCAAGNSQIFGLATTGVLYVAGNSKSCGQGRKWNSAELTPVVALSGYSIKRIFAYCSHSVAIDEKGRVFVCGSNNYGQIGLSGVTKTNTFQRIPIFDKHPVVSASLGDTFTAFVTDQMELYTCGDGDDFKLGNPTTDKVRVPTPANLAIGRSISWIACGCAHMIIAENMKSVPGHYGRMYFGLDGSVHKRFQKLPYRIENEFVHSLQKSISVDVSDYGTVWTGFMNGDKVSTESLGVGHVVGAASQGLVVKFDKETKVFELQNLREIFQKVEIVKRPSAELANAITRSGYSIPIDISESSCRVFGFAPGDVVEHPVLGKARVEGVFGGCLWFKFDDDDGQIVTTLVSEPSYLHEWLKVISPSKREIVYTKVEGADYPIETSPCAILAEFDIAAGDLVETSDTVGIVKGSFRHMALIEEVISKKLTFVTPNSLLLLRHFGKDPVYVDRVTLTNGGVAVNVSCQPGDKWLPYDRVITPRGTATVVGQADGKTWLATDDASAIGAGIGSMKDTSQFKLIRRLFHPGVNETGLSVSSDSFSGWPILPADIVIIGNVKYTVIGMTKDDKVVVAAGDRTRTFEKAEVQNASIVFRADLPATRIYYSKTGNGLTMSVSSRDFIGKRFIPDDVIKTPKGIGLVVGMTESNIGIHLANDDGVSFFTPQATYDASLFQLKQRRAIISAVTQ